MGFRENLKSQLQYSGLLVKELAAKSGIKNKTIDSYLGVHSYKPSAEAAVKIARVLGVSVEYLVTGETGEWYRPLASLPPDIRETIDILERLHPRDRKIVLTLARAVKER
jgi:transcriptional regulator with XRE-family HTH domain